MHYLGKNFIDVIKIVYDLSRPIGLGFLQYRDEPLTSEEALACIYDRGAEKIISMDYVNGRACKFHAKITEGGVIFPDKTWYDHSEEDLQELIRRCNNV